MAGADPLLPHIRHAEDWLRRARHDWRNGNAPAAMLRLMLAEAEIRHARERGAEGIAEPPRSTVPLAEWRRTGWSRAAAAIVAAAVLAAGLGYASMRPGLPRHNTLAARDGSAAGLPLKGGQVGGGIGRTIVRLDSGEFLMPDRGQAAAGGPGDPGFAGRDGTVLAGPDGRPLQLAVPVDLRTPSPTF
jgi:hypothetical protein